MIRVQIHTKICDVTFPFVCFPPAGDTLTAPLSLGKNVTLKIIRRFHFSSALKRMSAICSVSSASSAPAYLASVKGAPEVLRDMLTSIPDDYDVTYSKLMRQGARVLALGYKHLGNVTRGQVSKNMDAVQAYTCVCSVQREDSHQGKVPPLCPI